MSTRKANINSYERKARAEITKEIDAEAAGAIADVHERFDKGIARYRKRLDDCKAFLKTNKTRKNSSFTKRISSFSSNVSKCQAMITKIATLEREKLDQLQELEERKAYLINKQVKQELNELHSKLKMRNFAKSLHH
jgi:tRNA nucleotidyltransferase/poly(A) polymerase